MSSKDGRKSGPRATSEAGTGPRTTPRGGSGHSWSSLTSPELDRRASRDPVAILPLAAIEQHGPHLPLGTDLIIARGVVQRAVDLLGADPSDPAPLVLAEQAVGASREHGRHPGTVWLPARLVTDLMVSVGRSLARSGVRRLVIANGHGGNRAAMDEAALILRDEEEMWVVKATLARFLPPRSSLHERLPPGEWREGLHGGAVETSLLLHLEPESVRTSEFEATGSPHARAAEALRAGLKRVAPEGVAPFAWLAGDLHPSGVAGDPRLASAELGRLLLEYLAEELAHVVRDVGRMPLPSAPG